MEFLVHVGLVLLLACRPTACQHVGVDGLKGFDYRDHTFGQEGIEETIPASASDANSLLLPKFVAVTDARISKEIFQPEKLARALPQTVREMLLDASSVTSETSEPAGSNVVQLQCFIDRIIVGVRKDYFRALDVFRDLQFGTCHVNDVTRTHYNFKYSLDADCGFGVEVDPAVVSISNILRFQPSGHVIRDVPFDVLLRCNFHRYFHSYNVGYRPKLKGGTIFKALQLKNTIDDADIPIAKTYVLGEPMFFVARLPGGFEPDSFDKPQRTYINKCFITASPNPNSNPKHTVIDNQGCMVDGKLTEQSRFFPDESLMVQKLSVGSLIFHEKFSSQRLFMHCEIFVGDTTPTPSLKACNYDAASSSWKELYGDDSVCNCCDHTCSALDETTGKIISSPSFNAEADEGVSHDFQDNPASYYD